MISSIKIKNFKSIVNLELPLGKFNVLIGENGCGKSNILEAIAFGAAANADKLDFEFLGSRGIRVPNPQFMYSAFNKQESKKIEISLISDDEIFNDTTHIIYNDPANPKKWINETRDVVYKEVGDKLAEILFDKKGKTRQKELEQFFSDVEIKEGVKKFAERIKKATAEYGQPEQSKDFFKYIYNNHFLADKYSNPSISNYIIYSPEESSLRKFEETTQIYPLGIKGEGLFQYLKEINFNKKDKIKLKEIKESLYFVDWFENFELPENSLSNEFSLNIRDKYLSDDLQYFDQRSTNEGFLYLLFYATLFASEHTPKFFAIDNIDASFNPKLCVQLIKSLAELAKKHDKQVIVTTQNPAILDGLNLKDSNQRLFVVSRNSDGHTRAERINYHKDRTMKLSEVWTKGFIGGLPSNF